MCYRGGRGVVPTAGIRPGRMIVKFRCEHVAWLTTEIYDISVKLCQSRHRLLSGDAVRRSSLRCAPFGPPTVSCVLAPARTCLRQAPPTSRGRGLATSAVPHHLTDNMAMKAFILEK